MSSEVCNDCEEELDYDKLDPGIRETVRWLRSLGFETVDSGDGVTKSCDECSLEYPNVAIICDPIDIIHESERLYTALAAIGVDLTCIDLSECPCIQATYDPVAGSAIISLMYVGDALLNSCRKSPGLMS